MPAAVPSGSAPRRPILDRADAAEPFLLESVLSDIRSLRERSHRLVAEAAQAATHFRSNAWRRFQDEAAAVHERAEQSLVTAAGRDGLPADQLATRLSGSVRVRETQDEQVQVCRRQTHELEKHCTAVVGQAAALGLDHVVHALRRWRCELIGLERPLIQLNATIHALPPESGH